MNVKGILFLQFVGRIQMLNVHILKLKIVKKEEDCSAVFLVSSHIKAMENFLNTRTFRANVLQNLFCKLSHCLPLQSSKREILGYSWNLTPFSGSEALLVTFQNLYLVFYLMQCSNFSRKYLYSVNNLHFSTFPGLLYDMAAV